jgi:hypothetical protein
MNKAEDILSLLGDQSSAVILQEYVRRHLRAAERAKSGIPAIER